MDFDEEYLLAELTDDDNTLMDDDEDPGEDEDEAEIATEDETWVVRPVTTAERELAARVMVAEVNSSESVYAFSIEECGICNSSLESRALFVDGRLRDELMWSNLCAECFLERGAVIEWGTGQLFAKQDNGEWRMVAGFPR
jgi:hypothetical protein